MIIHVVHSEDKQVLLTLKHHLSLTWRHRFKSISVINRPSLVL